MKSPIFCRPRAALAVIMLCSQTAPVLLAQSSSPAPASAETAAPASASETHPIQLSSGVTDILKLGRAHVSDEAITAFISNFGKTYHLSVSEILYGSMYLTQIRRYPYKYGLTQFASCIIFGA
jgi:hypothetical protein